MYFILGLLIAMGLDQRQNQQRIGFKIFGIMVQILLINIDKTAIERQAIHLEAQIDQLVYELYGLTDKEIGIVEEATKR